MHRRMYAKDIEILFGIEIPEADGCFGKGKDGITEKQRTLIHNLGINVTGLNYKAQASVVISCALERREKGLASLKQIQTIRNIGITPDKPIYELTKTEASEILSKHLRGRW